MSRLRTWSAVAVTVAGLGLGLAGCGSSSSTGTTTTTTAAAPATTSTTDDSPATTTTPGGSTTTPGGSTTGTIAPITDPSPAGTFGTKPAITVPTGAPPTQLESSDLIAGTGATAETGDTVTVQYVLATYSAGKEVQASWGSQPFTFTVGQGVIQGWSEGVVGMKVGGRRELIIPPSLGYGAEAPATGIAPNDTLVFIVDLLSIQS